MSTNNLEPTVTSQFHGLFIGIDAYESPSVRNLASAVRDAQALHAVFSDNLGGDSTLLTDADATSSRLREELEALRDKSVPADVVVISFSGHGSETHELATYEANPYNLPATTLPLGEFTDLIASIPAKHLLVILDCCFSGGAGAKVLKSPRLSRGGIGGLPTSTTALLEQIAGTGRVLLTASTAEQEAWEDPRLGHGYLTYFLIKALLEPGEVAVKSQVNLLDLLKYVTHHVREIVSSKHGVRQDPTLRGQWDGEVIWPLFARGPRYNILHPLQPTDPVTESIRSLAGYGLPDQLLKSWAADLPSLNQLQQDAINEAGLLRGNNVIVTAPTSSGKTMVGELAALQATQTGGRSVFLLPTKALVNEQHERFERVYGPLGVRVVRATGDHNDHIDAILRGQFDIAIFTYEKFSGLVLAHPYLLRLVSVIVVDEVQTLVDASRGQELELLLTLVKTRRNQGVNPQIVALSAVLGNINGLHSWLGAYHLQSTTRPVPLEEGVLNLQGQYRYTDGGPEKTIQLLPATYGEARAKTLLIPLVQKLVQTGQQVIVIRGIRGEARGAAGYLAQSLGLDPAERALAAIPSDDPTRSSQELTNCLQHGVAFHVSDLSAVERRAIEREFREPDSKIRVVVATTTLAQGVNMPAETVILPEVSRRVGREIQWYSVAEYKNIAGRAGRLGLVDHGRAIVLATDYSTAMRVWENYICGAPEDVVSTLLDANIDLYTVVLRVVAIAGGRSEDDSAAVEDLIGILADSLAAHQARLRQTGDVFTAMQVAQAIAELQRVGFLETLDGGRTKLSMIGVIVASSALSVQSAIRITTVISQLSAAQLDTATFLTLAQVSQELDETRLTVNIKGVQKELQTFLRQLEQQRVASTAIGALRNWTNDRLVTAARAKKAVGCLLWIRGVSLADTEQALMQHYFDRNASGPIRAVVSRTHDVIDTIIALAAQLHNSAELDEIALLLPVRLELGIPTAAARLAVAGAGLDRGEYLRLTAANLTGPTEISQVDDGVLLPLLGDQATHLASLREAVASLAQQAATPTLDELLGSPDG